MPEVPSDILRDIFCRLPGETLLRFRAVCKAWRSIIDDPSFIKSHTINQQSYSTLFIRESNNGVRLYSFSLDFLNYVDGHQTIDVTPVKHLIQHDVHRLCDYLPVASCNGLILIYNRVVSKVWVIWNPLTRQFHKLPQPDTDLLTSGFDYRIDCFVSCGFGYDYASDDYKVVRIDKRHHDGITVRKTLVYSLKLGFWRMTEDCPCDISLVDEGVLLNGALHWRSQDGIIALDFGTEDYCQLPRPLMPTRRLDEHLDALGGCLVLSCYDSNMKSFEGWMMRDFGVEKSWIKLFSIERKLFLTEENLSPIDYVRGLRPVAFLKSKRQVFLQQYDNGLFWIDLENNSIKNVTIDGLPYFWSSQFCPGSLFRLDDSGSAVAKTTAGMKRKRKRKRKRAHRRWTRARKTVVKRQMKRRNPRLTFYVRNSGFQCHLNYDCI